MLSTRNNRRDIFGSRYYLIIGFILILMIILAVRLFVVTVLQNEKWTETAAAQTTRSVYTSAPRGNIYDRNGKVIANNKQMFTVMFNSSSMTTEEINHSALKLINLLKKNGDTYNDDFPIKIRKDGSMYYTYDKEKAKWLKRMHLPAGMSASAAFNALKTRYKIPKKTSRYKADKLLTGTYKLTVPINVKTMVYTYDSHKVQFLSKWGCFTDSQIEKGISAEDCFKALRKQYEINSSYSDKKARRIFIVRNGIASSGFQRYNPVTVAKNVSEKTIALVQESGIAGASISSQYKRNYPNKNAASHIVGYMGSISEENESHYVKDLGYSSSDLIGQAGIEAAFETKLHGTSGMTKIQVNNSGEYVRTISKTEPKKGKDVYLTLDLNLQKAAEKALKNGVRNAGKKCQSGAVVVMDVSTGDVLAMASYPDYDPNIFSNGITSKAWKSVQSKNERDPIAPAPLYNNATMASVPPGSTFKPVTAITALEKGLDPNREIKDKGYIKLGGHRFASSLYNDNKKTFGNENLELGIGHSNNYYFYCIGTGKDWGNGKSLGYSLSPNDLLNTASRFGLGHKTGIELNETISPLATKKTKIANYQNSCWQYLYANANRYFPSDVTGDYDKLKKKLDTISGWVKINPTYGKIYNGLEKLGVKESQLATLATTIKYDYCAEAIWSTGDQFNMCIGQGDNSYTPLQIATYISAVGNRGVYNRASIVSAVQGEGTIDKSGSKRTIKLKENTLNDVLKGMRKVCTGGTLQSIFGGYKIPVAGKTGTAENQGIPQPASEVKYVKNHLATFNAEAETSVTWEQVKKKMRSMMRNNPDRYPSEDDTVDSALKAVSKYRITNGIINSKKGTYDYYSWTVTLTPYKKPKIAVAAMLIQGGKSTKAAPINRAVISAYYNLYGKSGGKTVKNDNTGRNKAQ